MRVSRLIWRTIKWSFSGLLLLVLIITGYFLYPVMQDPEPDFAERKGKLLSADKTRTWQQHGALFEEYTLTSDSGLQVEISIRRPLHSQSPLPLAILLGGYGTGRHATELITQKFDVVIASLSYPYDGDRQMQGMGLVRNIRHIQQAMLDITPATLLTLDYLLQQQYVDTQQVELIGVSLGAFFVSIPAVLDQRVHRLWLVQGAGDPKSIFAYRMQTDVEAPWVRGQIAGLIALLGNVHHLTPERWVHRMPPRPVVVINSRGDPTFPPETVNILHQSLREPYEIIWLEGGHVRPSEAGIVRQLTDVVLKKIAAPSR